jgi:hypothetical protein
MDTYLGPEDTPALAQLTALTYLDMRNNLLLQGPIGALARLASLQHLDLSANSAMSACTDLATLRACTALTFLDLSQNFFKPLTVPLLAALADLTQLRTLKLIAMGEISMDGPAVRVIAASAHLRELHIAGASVTATGINALAQLVHLESLNVCAALYNSVENGVNISVLSALTALTRLDASYCNLSTEAAHVLQALPWHSLRDLTLQDAFAGPELIPLLNSLTTLTALDLSGNDMLDSTAVAGLAEAPSLQRLTLTGMPQLCNKAALGLSRLPVLAYLSISSDRLARSGALALAGMPSLTRLVLQSSCADKRRSQKMKAAIRVLERAPSLAFQIVAVGNRM